MHGLAHALIAAERERQVRYAAGDVHMRQVRLDPARRLDEIDAVIVVLLHAGGDGEDVRIEDDVLGRKADRVHQNVVGALADRRLALERVGLALFVEGHHHHGGAVAAHDLGVLDEGGLALLHGNRIHHRLALQAFQPGLDHREFRRVDHHRHARDVRLGGDQIEEGHHGGFRVEEALVHVDVDDLRAVLHLLARDRQRARIIAGGDQLAELGRAGDVGALADIHERDFRRQRKGFQPGQPQLPRHLGYRARRLARHRLGDRRDMVRRGAAAAADHVDQPGRGEFAEQFGHRLRALVVITEFVGQPGVRIGAHERIGEAAEFGDMGAHLARAQRAIQADGDRAGVAHRIPECRRRLPRQQAARAVGDGARDHHRQVDAAFGAGFDDGVDRRLGVERVEDGLDQQEIGAAVDQALDLLAIGLAQLVEADGAEAGIAHVRRNRGRAVGRPERAGDKPLAAVFLFRRRGRLARQRRAGMVELVGDALHAVIGLRDLGGGECVGGDDVGAGAKVSQMDVAHRVRPAQIEQVVVAAHFAVPGVEARAAITLLVQLERLDHGAHGAVEHQDALLHQLTERGAGIGRRCHLTGLRN